MKLKPEKIELENNEYCLNADITSGSEAKFKITINGKDITNKVVGLILVKDIGLEK